MVSWRSLRSLRSTCSSTPLSNTRKRARTHDDDNRTMTLNRNPSQRNYHHLLTLLIILLFSTSILIKVGTKIWIKNRLREMGMKPFDEYGYEGYDYPAQWPIYRGNVLMAFDNPRRYALDTPQGAMEWASLVPPLTGSLNSSSDKNGGGVVYLGKSKRPYTISMFHQLRCLDILREETIRPRPSSPSSTSTHSSHSPHSSHSHSQVLLTRHCLNYLRQTITCRADLELESFQYASHHDPIDLHGVYECKDWEKVYAAVEMNWEGR